MASAARDEGRVPAAAAGGSQHEAVRNFAAAAATGAVTMGMTNWLDCFRIRWQVEGAARGGGAAAHLVRVLKDEGVWRGLQRHALGVNLCACTCSMGCRIGAYPTVRDLFGAKGGDGASSARMFAAGICSGMVGYWLAAPLFMVKTQLQAEAGVVGPDGVLRTGAAAGRRPTYASAFDALRETVRAKGLRGLYSGAALFTARGATLSGSQLAAYDFTKTACLARGAAADGPALHAFASSVASLSLTFWCMPLDNLFTRFQAMKLHAAHPAARASVTAAARAVYADSGAAGFWRGWSAMLMRMYPSSIATFYLYEQIRAMLGLAYLD
eukprot:TRINITY_DN32350_c0_g1_i1.p1 TRINITY_DN32350_c0_g1~~TRINITY_DN32350_c0_g1_i1.p1  ORF type:complete len:326 (+),score=89.68 TRINITY_DN32350_c0_g1_i1:136-1113(+)